MNAEELILSNGSEIKNFINRSLRTTRCNNDSWRNPEHIAKRMSAALRNIVFARAGRERWQTEFPDEESEILKLCAERLNRHREDHHEEFVESIRKRGPSTSSISGYKGVNYSRTHASWQACLRRDGHHIFSGYFQHEVHAAFAYDKAVLSNGEVTSYLNFPLFSIIHFALYGNKPVLKKRTAAESNRIRGPGPRNASGFIGVDWDKRRGKWRAQINKGPGKKDMTHFENKVDAALWFDKSALLRDTENAYLNFPLFSILCYSWHPNYMILPKLTRTEAVRASGPHSTNSVGFKGVWRDKKTGRFVASIHSNGKHIGLGCFDNAEDAARAYDKAARQYFGEHAYQNFPYELAA